MFYLTGTAASSALDLIATLQQTLGAKSSGGAQPSAAGFDPGTSGAGGASGTDPTAPTSPTSLLAPDTLDALLVVQGQGQAPVVPLVLPGSKPVAVVCVPLELFVPSVCCRAAIRSSALEAAVPVR